MTGKFKQINGLSEMSSLIPVIRDIHSLQLVILLVSLLVGGTSPAVLAEDDFFLHSNLGAETSPHIALRDFLHFDSTIAERSSEPGLPNSVFQVDPIPHHQLVDVPEPLLFDLVRPLGARKGEVEVNTLAIFPWKASNTNPSNDPFGPSPTTFDKERIEWAPEIEYAIADNFAIEFEFPFEAGTLEEYKLGLQWTIGTAFNNHYIHGFQVLIQPTSAWSHWNSTLLYLGGIRFDETWSALFMLGGRMDLEGPNNSKNFERLFNASLFADLSDSARVGLETNYASKADGTSEFILVPQIHYQFTDSLQVQTGLGLGVFSEGSEQSFILRVVYSN